MSIYSTNRMGRVSEATIVANENYGANDIGRILYESQVNDQAIFEAVIASDFAEIKGLREGTLLESEIESLNEASAKEFFNTLKKRLANFWAKIKGVFKSVIAKITYFITNDGARFLKYFNSEYTAKKYNEGKERGKKEFSGVKVFKQATLRDLEKKIPGVDDYKGLILARKEGERKDKTTIIGEILGEYLDKKGTVLAPKEFSEKLFGDHADEIKSVDTFIEFAKDALTNNRGAIKELKQTQNAIEKKLGELKNELYKEERNLLKDDASKDEKKENRLSIANISTIVSAFESATGTICTGLIKANKLNVRVAYAGLNQILAICRKAPIVEAAALVAEDEFDDAFDTEIESLPAETQESIDAAVDAVEVDAE